jgi:hypothetical protein
MGKTRGNEESSHAWRQWAAHAKWILSDPIHCLPAHYPVDKLGDWILNSEKIVWYELKGKN